MECKGIRNGEVTKCMEYPVNKTNFKQVVDWFLAKAFLNCRKQTTYIKVMENR